MAYVAIDPNNLLPGKPITAAIMQALDGNVVETAEGATGSPYVQAGWHPVDGVTVGDGNTGIIWDFATDDTFTAVDYTVEAGYEYRMECEDYAGGAMTLQGRQTENGSYSNWLAATNMSAFRLEIYTPNVVRDDHIATGVYSQGVVTTAINGTIRNTNGTAIDRIRVSTASAAQTAGTIRMYQRLAYR